MLGIRKCTRCNKEIEIFHKIRLTQENIFCSNECKNEYKKEQNKNCVCPICGEKFHVKPYRKNKSDKNYCSRKCFAEAKKEYMKGEGNHQFGLKGKLNSSWKSDEYVNNYGYLYKRVIDHPFKNKRGFVLEHRLVAEKFLLNIENSVEINGKRYLKPELVVHHKDGNKLNNKVENLEIMTLENHEALHSCERNTKKVEKLDENGNVLEIYKSVKEAAEKNNALPQNISSACKKRKKIKGFYWKHHIEGGIGSSGV